MLALSIATKGIVYPNSLGAKGFTIISISETPIRRRKGVGVQDLNEKIVKVTFMYEGKTITAKSKVNRNTSVSVSNIVLNIDESGKPTVTFKMLK